MPLRSTTSGVVVAEVTAAGSTDGDGSAFACSLDGRRWTTLITVASGTTGAHTATLPSGTSGDLLVRVTDTDRTASEVVLDTVTVDHLHVRAG